MNSWKMIVERNVSKTFTSEIEVKNPQYEQLLADVWVGIVLTLLLLSCVCCMCSCLLYHKFQQWKRSVLRNTLEPETNSPNAINFDCESLPSYTIASGLPTYEEALQQMDKNFEKGSYLPKEDSTASIRLGPTQSNSKVSVLEYLNNFVHEKT